MKTPLPPIPLTIVFDLDGTLVDTVADICAAFDRALEHYGIGTLSPDEGAMMMGEGLSGFFWRAIVAKRLDLPAGEAGEALNRFINTYAQTPVRLSRLYSGIPELLDDVKRSGARMAVCTNKVERISLQILDQLGILDMFDAVVGFRDDRAKKPDPRPLREAIALAGGTPERTLMIGDTGADTGAAVAAGLPVILVTYGYSSFSVRAVSATCHVETAYELHEQIMRFIASDGRAWLRAPLHHG
ncbi:HAD-IA family hydrolase [Hyphomicrobium sp. CS1GBMeth3]|uniref:HAD family hydrolase n=1 Tax=Hyphomicrobium sp. CS1GBMeth3 TaxID=1892845 RepID=UPI0009316A4D|nr:HAD-IA family hydrolase [Hyphomicrobium sp. CS1GBMeth3]